MDADQQNQTPAEITFDCPGCCESVRLPKATVGQFTVCPSCGLSIGVDASAAVDTPSYSGSDGLSSQSETNATRRIVAFRVFRLKLFSTWEELFQEAASFASDLPEADVISFSHSSGNGAGDDAVTVWYWRQA